MAAFDYKKEYKEFYLPKAQPALIDVPAMCFIAVDGEGDPNTSPAYKTAMEILYGLSFTIKMSKMGATRLEGFFDYVVPPLEGLWQTEGVHFDGLQPADKSLFRWTSMIRQPEFVNETVFAWAKEQLKKKKPDLDLSAARFLSWEEGLCVQVMHIGPYDTEPDSIRKMDDFAKEQGYHTDFSDGRRHHEIYLGDPRRTKPERLRTVIRHPVAKG